MVDQLVFIVSVIAMLTVFTIDIVQKTRGGAHRK